LISKDEALINIGLLPLRLEDVNGIRVVPVHLTFEITIYINARPENWI
jgi:hypothetical protein